MSQPVEITGYAIVSDDDMIADASGEVPPQLRNETDWRLYQEAQADSDLVVFASVSHNNEPNTRGDLRLVISRTAKRLERRGTDWWWNPAETSWRDVVSAVLPNSGKIAVGGGKAAFDLFLGIGYSEFHLVRARGVSLPGGHCIFSECEEGASAEAVLQKHKLRLAEQIELDKAKRVAMQIFKAAG